MCDLRIKEKVYAIFDGLHRTDAGQRTIIHAIARIEPLAQVNLNTIFRKLWSALDTYYFYLAFIQKILPFELLAMLKGLFGVCDSRFKPEDRFDRIKHVNSINYVCI